MVFFRYFEGIFEIARQRAVGNPVKSQGESHPGLHDSYRQADDKLNMYDGFLNLIGVNNPNPPREHLPNIWTL